MTEPPIDHVSALVRDARAALAAIQRDELRIADPAGELGILVGALERVVAKLEDRLAQLGREPATAGDGAPAARQAPAPKAPSPAKGQESLSDVQTSERRVRLSPTGMVAYDLLQDGASREQVVAYLDRHFASSDPEEVLVEVDEWVHRGRRG